MTAAAVHTSKVVALHWLHFATAAERRVLQRILSTTGLQLDLIDNRNPRGAQRHCPAATAAKLPDGFSGRHEHRAADTGSAPAFGFRDATQLLCKGAPALHALIASSRHRTMGESCDIATKCNVLLGVPAAAAAVGRLHPVRQRRRQRQTPTGCQGGVPYKCPCSCHPNRHILLFMPGMLGFAEGKVRCWEPPLAVGQSTAPKRWSQGAFFNRVAGIHRGRADLPGGAAGGGPAHSQ